MLTAFDGDHLFKGTAGVLPAAAPPRGSRRLIVVNDEAGNQALRLVPEDRGIYVMYLPAAGSEPDRRAIKDEFARIGGGLTTVADRTGEGEWHPGDRPPVFVSTDVVTGIGPYTPEAREEFLRVLSLLGRLLGQELVLGLALPIGEVFEVWDHCLVKVKPGGGGRRPASDSDIPQ